MSQVYEFRMVGIEADGDCASLKLVGKFDKVYTSQVFLRVPLEELSKFSIGQIYSLRAQQGGELIETVPLGQSRAVWDDGSPVVEEGEAQ